MWYRNSELRLRDPLCSDFVRKKSRRPLGTCRFVVTVVLHMRVKDQIAEAVRRVLGEVQILLADGADQHRRTLGPWRRDIWGGKQILEKTEMDERKQNRHKETFLPVFSFSPTLSFYKEWSAFFVAVSCKVQDRARLWVSGLLSKGLTTLRDKWRVGVRFRGFFIWCNFFLLFNTTGVDASFFS